MYERKYISAAVSVRGRMWYDKKTERTGKERQEKMEIRDCILYEDREIIVCRKPAGVPVQTKQMQTKDMVSLLKNYRFQQEKSGREPYIGVIHRLDQPVEGILVFAKTPQAAKELNRQLQTGAFGKHYQAVLCGIPEHEQGNLMNYLVKDGRTNLSKICKKTEAGAKEARLSYEILKKAEGKALAKIQLDTGRHHQIRVQMSGIGCPILGDVKYGGEERKRGQIALCAYCLEFLHPKTKKPMQFELQPAAEGFEAFF